MSLYADDLASSDCGVDIDTNVCIQRRMTSNLTIENEVACLQRNPIIVIGVSVIIELGGEFFIL